MTQIVEHSIDIVDLLEDTKRMFDEMHIGTTGMASNVAYLALMGVLGVPKEEITGATPQEFQRVKLPALIDALKDPKNKAVRALYNESLKIDKEEIKNHSSTR
ncbi:MAG: hypothetical protein EBR02_08750 [Alphaproteobacteria bacterium]|nr:hypothetical protein [Alphaproteobacteria bacterium]